MGQPQYPQQQPQYGQQPHFAQQTSYSHPAPSQQYAGQPSVIPGHQPSAGSYVMISNAKGHYLVDTGEDSYCRSNAVGWKSGFPVNSNVWYEESAGPGQCRLRSPFNRYLGVKSNGSCGWFAPLNPETLFTKIHVNAQVTHYQSMNCQRYLGLGTLVGSVKSDSNPSKDHCQLQVHPFSGIFSPPQPYVNPNSQTQPTSVCTPAVVCTGGGGGGKGRTTTTTVTSYGPGGVQQTTQVVKVNGGGGGRRGGGKGCCAHTECFRCGGRGKEHHMNSSCKGHGCIFCKPCPACSGIGHIDGYVERCCKCNGKGKNHEFSGNCSGAACIFCKPCKRCQATGYLRPGAVSCR